MLVCDYKNFFHGINLVYNIFRLGGTYNFVLQFPQRPS